MATLTPTHEVIRTIVNVRSQLRDAYVDLRGVDCVWYAFDTDVEPRRNLYGEITDNPTLKEGVPVKIVLDLNHYLQVMDTKTDVATDERDAGALEGAIKFSSQIKIGDRIEVPFSHFLPSVENKIMQVVDVRIVPHVGELSKKVVLAPLRDA